MRILILYNAPLLDPDHPDYAQEAGVLESVEAVAAALAPKGHVIDRLGLANDVEPLVRMAHGSSRPDVVVNFCEGFAGSPALEPHAAGLLDLLEMPYTGSPAAALALARDKARTKLLLQGAGLPTPAFEVVEVGRQATEQIVRRLDGGPLFVKPAAEDASLGIGPESVVSTAGALAAKVVDIHRRYGAALVERFIDGREFNTSVMALPEPQVLPLAEVNFQRGASGGWGIVTYDAKWTTQSAAWTGTPVTCPAEVDEAPAARLREASLDAYHIVGCRNYARVDLRVDAAGDPFILEINANPDLAPTAGFARSLAAAGISYADFCERLVATAFERRRS
jgi:D-alanine-D-alanine ligase